MGLEPDDGKFLDRYSAVALMRRQLLGSRNQGCLVDDVFCALF